MPWLKITTTTQPQPQPQPQPRSRLKILAIRVSNAQRHFSCGFREEGKEKIAKRAESLSQVVVHLEELHQADVGDETHQNAEISEGRRD